MTFAALGLSDNIIQATHKQGYKTPSPIQEQAIPHILQGRDVMAMAKTGTGKTAGFTLPILQQLLSGPRPAANQAHALILAPTRELAAQIGDSITAYSEFTEIRSAVVFGGVKINPQMQRLRRGVDILVATPGRLLDLYKNNAVRFNHLQCLVLDEADRMLDMGFIHDIRKILNVLPKKRQSLLFSATFSDPIRTLAQEIVNKPVEISVSPRNTTAPTVEQLVHPVDKKRKPELLLNLLRENSWHQVLVFARTQHGSNRLARFLETKGIKTAAIHGRKSQAARTKALSDFKSGKVSVLVATDIAARGLDINLLPQVINFELPNTAEDYVHRIGRTGRAGASGHARSLVCADEFKQLFEIERLIQMRVTRELIDGFEPEHDVPESKAPLKAIRAKKPKRLPKAPSSRDSKAPNQRRKRPEGLKAAGRKRSNNANSQSSDKPNHSNGEKPKRFAKTNKKPNTRNRSRANSNSALSES